MEENKEELEDVDSPYCPVCGGCGYIGCCGIREFLEKHVKGKTDCTEEESFINEILEWIEPELEKIWDSVPTEDEPTKGN